MKRGTGLGKNFLSKEDAVGAYTDEFADLTQKFY
jgi:hypothetical protein